MTRSSQHQPVDGTLADRRRDRCDQIARRFAASSGASGDRLERYLKTLILSFEPEDTATGTVLAPAQAQRAQLRQMISDHWAQIALLLLFGVFILIIGWTSGWGGAFILFLLVAHGVCLYCGLSILQWRNGIAENSGLLPSAGSIIAAQTAALIVNGIATPWDQVVLDTISLRVAPLMDPYTARVGVPAWIARVRLIVAGRPLALDSALLTNGQVLLDTICDKLDLNAHPARQGDVAAHDLPIYPAPISGALSRTPMGAAMTTFDKREEGFEKKFAHDEELRFKANARRNKMFGLWAAEKLGISGDAANVYAKDVVMAAFEGGDDDVFKKVRTDLDAKGVTVSDAELRREIVELTDKAIAEIKASG